MMHFQQVTLQQAEKEHLTVLVLYRHDDYDVYFTDTIRFNEYDQWISLDYEGGWDNINPLGYANPIFYLLEDA